MAGPRYTVFHLIKVGGWRGTSEVLWGERGAKEWAEE